MEQQLFPTPGQRGTIQRICAWCGLIFPFALFGGWMIAGFIPPPDPSHSATEVASFYSHNPDLKRFGLMICMSLMLLVIPFSLSVSLQMRRAEGTWPVLAVMQFAFGIVTGLILIIPMLIFIVATFRPDRSPELTQMLNDMGWVMVVLPFPPIIGQSLPFAASVLMDRRKDPVFPRWLAYFNLWLCVMVIPVVLLVFWTFGPYSWHGWFGFWLPAIAFGAWYPVMVFYVLRAIRQEQEELTTSAPRARVTVPTAVPA